MAKLSWFPRGDTAANDTTAGLAKPALGKPLGLFDVHPVAVKMTEFRCRKNSRRRRCSRSDALFPAELTKRAFPSENKAMITVQGGCSRAVTAKQVSNVHIDSIKRRTH